VATLAMLTIARGFTMLYTGGHPVSNLGENFAVIGAGSFIGIPVPVWIAAMVVLLAAFICSKTRLGRYIYAIGGNETAAKLSGIRINRVKITVYTIGAVGQMSDCYLPTFSPTQTSYELDAIAAGNEWWSAVP
jgi:ribose transport system permease protein